MSACVRPDEHSSRIYVPLRNDVANKLNCFEEVTLVSSAIFVDVDGGEPNAVPASEP